MVSLCLYGDQHSPSGLCCQRYFVGSHPEQNKETFNRGTLCSPILPYLLFPLHLYCGKFPSGSENSLLSFSVSLAEKTVRISGRILCALFYPFLPGGMLYWSKFHVLQDNDRSGLFLQLAGLRGRSTDSLCFLLCDTSGSAADRLRLFCLSGFPPFCQAEDKNETLPYSEYRGCPLFRNLPD